MTNGALVDKYASQSNVIDEILQDYHDSHSRSQEHKASLQSLVATITRQRSPVPNSPGSPRQNSKAGTTYRGLTTPDEAPIEHSE